MVPRGLLGRGRECDALDGVLDAARAGRSEVLVLRGEPGVGKSALLDHVGQRATGCRVVRTAGIESEGELAYAGLHQVCAPILDRIDRLPGPQGEALGTAFGLLDGDAPDVFLVGLAVLGLLSDAAETQPLVGIVDDAQWLDRQSAQALAFVARRLLADSVALVFAVREPVPTRELDGLPTLVVEGLGPDDARALLDAVVPGRLDGQVRDRILAETGGNPLALLELTHGRSPADLAGGFAVPGTDRLTGRIEESLAQRLRALPPESQLLLCLAAAEPVGDPTLLWRAAGALGISVDAAAAPEAAGLLDLDGGVRFSHPLVRSTAYRSATPADRRAVHRALAEATDPDRDADRRAWHRGQAVVEPDEEVARQLERSAASARRRGGAAAAAAFLERATELTPDAGHRGARALDAARAALTAAAPARAAALITTAEWCPLDELQQTTAVQLRARIAFAQSHGSDAPPLLLAAARRLEPLDPVLARDAYLEALEAGIYAGRLAVVPTLAEVAVSARRAAPTAPDDPGARVVDLLVDALAARFTEGYVSAVPALRRVLDRLLAEGDAEGIVPWLWVGCRIAAELWDDEALEVLTERQLTLARATGALTVLPLAIAYRAGLHLHHGELAAGAAMSAEANALAASVGGPQVGYPGVLAAAWRGDETTLQATLGPGLRSLTSRGEGRSLSWAEYARAVLDTGHGRYPTAHDAAASAAAHDDLGITGWAQVEEVEAAARAGRADAARAAVERLAVRTHASGTPWALGVEARSRALVSEGDAAEDLYREALDHLGRTRVAVHLARTHLAYGEWLRRESRRVDAREQLRTAHELFTGFGAEAFAERARRELLATGETARRRSVDEATALTAQEAQIARLAREGHTNPEIGSQLFISPRTVEYHLRKVFTKLGISSRRELRRTPLGAI